MRYFNRDSGDYEFKDKFEAGLALSGSDAKSLRTQGVHFNGSKIEVINSIPTIFNLTIDPYKYSQNQTIDTTNERKLLLKDKEIAKLQSYRNQKYMLIPIAIFLKGKWFKVEIGVGRKLRQYEKREKIRKEEMKNGLK
jgi:SsrA-binding protein